MNTKLDTLIKQAQFRLQHCKDPFQRELIDIIERYRDADDHHRSDVIGGINLQIRAMEREGTPKEQLDSLKGLYRQLYGINTGLQNDRAELISKIFCPIRPDAGSHPYTITTRRALA